MRDLRSYIREVLLKENEYRWDTASKKTMLLDKEGMEDSDKDKQEEYLKSMGLMESAHSSLPILIPGPPDEAQRVAELKMISDQYRSRRNPEGLQQALDEAAPELFNEIVKSAGYPCMLGTLNEVKSALRPIVMYHKDHFDSLRPNELAERAGVPFQSDFLESAQTPSYPSGHTAQAFFLAHFLSDRFPELSTDFYTLAQMVADSRIDRGVHFPSDNEAGKLLAQKLHDMIG